MAESRPQPAQQTEPPSDSTVPKVVVSRLSLYLRELQRLEAAGQATISSGQLGTLLGFSDAQVRKDLGFFGQFGYPAETIHAKGIRLGMIVVPAARAQEAADRLVAAGIEGIVNFAPVTLVLPPHVQNVGVDLAIELEQLSFSVTSKLARIQADQPTPVES